MKKRTEKERIKEKIKVIPHGAYEAGMTDRQACLLYTSDAADE